MVVTGTPTSGEARRSVLGGPRWGYPLLLGASCALLLVDASAPGWSTVITVGALLLWIPLGLLWCARLVLVLAGRSRWREVVVTPVVILATLAVCASGLPLRARFEPSRGAFDALVASLPPGSDVPLDERVGTYRIHSASQRFGGVALVEGWYGEPRGTGGFALLPDGPDQDALTGPGAPRWRDLGGGWWAWTDTR